MESLGLSGGEAHDVARRRSPHQKGKAAAREKQPSPRATLGRVAVGSASSERRVQCFELKKPPVVHARVPHGAGDKSDGGAEADPRLAGRRAAPEAGRATTPPARRAEGRPNRSRKERETSSQNGFSQNVDEICFTCSSFCVC